MARILIVEDEPMIAMMLADWLEDLGHQPVGPAVSIKQATEMIGQAGFDAAILDVHLVDGRSDAIADALSAAAIPYTFATGGSAESLDPRFRSVPRIAKPYDFEALSGIVAKLCGTNR